MPEPPFPFSKGAVDRAGRTLVDLIQTALEYRELPADRLAPSGRPIPSAEEVSDALAAANAWRASVSRPLGEITTGLRSFARSQRCGLHGDARITQRHKQLSSITGKLARDDGRFGLSQLEDIGGCRVILDDRDELARMRAHIERNWGPDAGSSRVIRRTRDYIDQPRDTGYRAVHLIVELRKRRVEIQLRTRFMHDWADQVERIGRDYKWPQIKAGYAPDDLLNFFRVVADMNACDEVGVEIPTALEDEYAESLARARDVIEERRRELFDG